MREDQMTDGPTPTNRPLRVAIAMLTLVPGAMGGGETYARGLLRGLASTKGVAATTFVSGVGKGFSGEIPEVVCPEVSGGPSSTERIKTLLQGFLHRKGLVARMEGNDVFHVPFAVNLPSPPRSMATVQSLCDVQHRDLPHLFSRVERIYRSFFYERAARKADAVVTISDFAKRTIVEHLGIAPEKVFTAHLAVDSEQFTPNIGERENFIFYPARGWAHKNHTVLFEAMRLLMTERPELTLVLTGGGLEGLTNVPANVDVKGLVPFQELLELYRKAKCLVFPSLYEGFGLPPLEAMASGCPVASSTAGSLPEVCGDAAVMFDPHSPRAIADAIVEAIGRTSELQAKGFEQVRRFTWEKCAEAHEAAYRYAVQQRALTKV
ncbi:glycosyltransferase family 1 protein [Arthrobacter sp. NPDC080086]|uniref:glycosyltransferase family 4 protein n=2 Tax=Arthrobacter TaxID=1663 RepID=UPI00344F45C9